MRGTPAFSTVFGAQVVPSAAGVIHLERRKRGATRGATVHENADAQLPFRNRLIGTQRTRTHPSPTSAPSRPQPHTQYPCLAYFLSRERGRWDRAGVDGMCYTESVGIPTFLEGVVHTHLSPQGGEEGVRKRARASVSRPYSLSRARHHHSKRQRRETVCRGGVYSAGTSLRLVSCPFRFSYVAAAADSSSREEEGMMMIGRVRGRLSREKRPQHR